MKYISDFYILIMCMYARTSIMCSLRQIFDWYDFNEDMEYVKNRLLLIRLNNPIFYEGDSRVLERYVWYFKYWGGLYRMVFDPSSWIHYRYGTSINDDYDENQFLFKNKNLNLDYCYILGIKSLKNIKSQLEYICTYKHSYRHLNRDYS